jgi:sigma-B regulation protein RsbU (phosphoserine phosphatase)
MINDDKKSVLIVDDDIIIRKLLNHQLKHNGYTAYQASGPAEAFEILKNSKIDLVLCDVTMDEMDGFEFCKIVRENENFRALPFVFVTAKTSMEDKSKALEVGGDDIITKPFDVNELLLKVRALIRRSEIYKVYGVKKNLEHSFSQQTSKILLVDDDHSLAKLFQYNLIKAGFECEIATNAEDGLRLAKSIQPDIIISDIMMPNIDGFQFRRMILTDNNLRSVPFVFLTSKGEEKDILDGYDLGIADYVLKTAGPRVVVAKVSAVIKSLGKERQKIVTELHQAADSLRVKVVPDNFPEFPGFDIRHWHIPFHGIPGGDFIDYFSIDEDNIAVVLGDVMGKKWGAWYFAFAYAGYVRSALRVALQTINEFSPGLILQQVNKSVYQDAKVSEVFATLSILTINKITKVIKYAGAGDLPIIYRNDALGTTEIIRSKGLLLGFAEQGNYEDITLNVKPGDFIILTTDGVIESRNSNGIQYGLDNLKDVTTAIKSSDDPVELIKRDFDDFTGQKYEDDISLIEIKCI